MKISAFVLSLGLLAPAVSAFQTPHVVSQRFVPLNMQSMMGTGIDISETAQRDVYTMQNWAQSMGVQLAEGVELTTYDGEDYSVVTNAGIGAGTPVMWVPSSLILTSGSVEQEYGNSLYQAEQTLTAYEGTAQRLPLFRLMIKILAEYEKGEQSPWYNWLNSLPRRFYNGAAMTDSCFECLPPYAASLAMTERNAYSRFVNALRNGNVPLSQGTLSDDVLMKWAFNVALTRFNEVWEPVREKKIAPMADMFNHATYPNIEVTYDYEGNAVATALSDIPPGSPLTITLGNPTNPTPLFAKYGFLYDDCTTIFCKALELEGYISALEYNFNDLLFETQTGDIAPKVWDIFLCQVLEQDPDAQGQFFVACKTNDDQTKESFHAEYFPYTLQALKNHVDSIIADIDNLTAKAQSYDLNTHPRVPVIVAHNNLVRSTFELVQAQLYAMG